MDKFEAGDTVAVSATIQPGAFPGEHLVTVETTSGPVSGFVRAQDVVEQGKTIQAVVREATASRLEVKLAGSYFTTNGLVELSAEWAKQNVKAIA